MSAHVLTNRHVQELLADHEAPCVSLYQPTHPGYPQSQQDPIRFRNLLDQATSALRENFSHQQTQAVLGLLQPLVQDDRFWKDATGGLAVFASPAQSRHLKVRHTLPELVVVGESFHVKPLIRLLQDDERFQILALTLSEAKLYEGTRDTIAPVSLNGIPSTLTEALGTQLTENQLRVTRSHGLGTAGPGPMFHGQGARKDERTLDRERFFRIIEREIRQHFSNRTQLPLLLASLPEHQAHFREHSHNPHLLKTPLAINPDALSLDELREAAWKLIEPFFEERLERMKERYGEAHAHQRGSDDIREVAEALEQGRVGTLLVEADRYVPEGNEPASEDLLDEIAEGVLRTGGEVFVVPAPRMPTRTGVAAIYRF